MNNNFNVEEIIENVIQECRNLINDLNHTSNPKKYDKEILEQTEKILYEFQKLKNDPNYKIPDYIWRMIVDSYPWNNFVSKALKKYTDYLDYKYYQDRREKKDK